MDDDNGVLSAARAIRPYLSQLIGHRAPETDATLAGLLDRVHGLTLELRDLLNDDPATADFVVEVLADAPHYRPPDVQPEGGTRGPALTKNWQGLPGEPGPIGVDVFTCPEGDYTWYRRSIGVPTPTCPTHRKPLVMRIGAQ